MWRAAALLPAANPAGSVGYRPEADIARVSRGILRLLRDNAYHTNQLGITPMYRESWSYSLGFFSCIAFASAACGFAVIFLGGHLLGNGWVWLGEAAIAVILAGLLLGVMGLIRSRGRDRMFAAVGFILNLATASIAFVIVYGFSHMRM